MKKLLRMGWLGLALGLCLLPALAQRSESEVIRPYQLEDLKTFRFQEFGRRSTDPLALYPEAEQWIRDEVVRLLGERAIEEVTEAEQADFEIRISAATVPRTRKVRSSHLTNTFLENSLEGTLTLLFVDPAGQEAFWKGWAVDQAPLTKDGVDLKPQKGRKMVERGVRKILKRFFKDAGP